MSAPLQFKRMLRRRQTAAERVMWHLLRDRRLAGAKFRRQHAIGPFVVDFVALASGLVIEVDGCTHEHRARQDARRDRALEELGFRVLRFPGFQVTTNPDFVLRQILGLLIQ